MGFFSALFGSGGGRAARGVSPHTKSMIQAEWDKINTLIQGGSPSQLRQAVISADKTLDNAMRDMIPGETMGERLKNARDKFDRVTYDKVWKAHKMRNSLVHESGFEPSHSMVTRAINDLKAGLAELGVRV